MAEGTIAGKLIGSFAYMDETVVSSGMMNGDGMQSCMANGMWLMAVLWALLMLTLITLGLMTIVILYRKHFASSPDKKMRGKNDEQ